MLSELRFEFKVM